MQTAEKQLMEAAQRGELPAATELVDRHYPAIYAFLRRLSGSDSDAADLTQKTFVRVWPALARFAARSSVKSWLHGIAHHVYLDWRRGQHRLEMRPDEWWVACADERATPDSTAADADEAAGLYAAVEQLEADLRSTVHLHHYQGLTLDETADALGIATSTVKYRLRMALQRLKAALADPTPFTRNPSLSRTP